MSRVLFRQIPVGSRLLGVGNFFRAPTRDARWRLGAFFERDEQLQLQRFALEMSCVLAVGREFSGEEGAPYRRGGFAKVVELPSIDGWQERPLGECPRLARRLAANPEISGQRCFVFETGGLTVWLPKFELARKLFFHAAFLVRAALEPNGLDMVFTTYREGDVFHVHTPAKTGAPSQLLKIKAYRDHFSWLLLRQDVKRSFESIWHRLNQEQERVSQDSTYVRWKFDFRPPASLAGAAMNVRGAFDPKRKELLIWEIEALRGLRLDHNGDIFFHHPALKMPVRGEGAVCISLALGGEEIDVDTEDEPTATNKPQLINLPYEGVAIDGQLVTKVAYAGECASRHGRKIDDEQLPGDASKTLGVADPVSGGGIAPGEFQQLADKEFQKRFADRFSQLSEIIEQIDEESDIALVKLEVKPLPQVPRCRYHKIDNATPRCYLLARFRLKNGSERYLLEMDTSDKRKPMSTRIIGFKEDVDPEEAIGKILKETVKGSLRWPSSMAKRCDPLRAVHHPKENSSSANHTRVLDWKHRIRSALC